MKFLFLLAIFFSPLAHAELSAGSCSDAEKALVSTQHTTTLNGKTLQYTATVGFLEVTADDNSSKACVFYTAYTVVPEAGASPRPITFAFNGGPGSASLWLHLGLLGPKRVDMGEDGLTAPNNPTLLDNDSSLLDMTDIVMIDPVETGFSRALDPKTTDKFFGIKNDYSSIERFIQNYLNANNRWRSPKYILGESYGGIRGTLLARHLQSDYNIAIDGLILISPSLSETSQVFSDPDNTTPYWTWFPNFAATAWYHKLSKTELRALSVEAFYKQARAFANTRLRDALDQGDLLDDSERDAVAQLISDFTGISKEHVLELNLRVSPEDIFTDLIPGTIVGRFDSRFTAPLVSRQDYQDPSSTSVAYPFTIAINDYLRTDLQLPIKSPYNISAYVTSWPSEGPGLINVMRDMSQALATNPKFRVLIASGYFDLACPMGSVEYEIAQLPNGTRLGSRVSQKKYFAGHMMYINPTALKQLKSDIAAFMSN